MKAEYCSIELEAPQDAIDRIKPTLEESVSVFNKAFIDRPARQYHDW
jgi:hypothetical protein